jgi:hypothetical protein
MTQMAKILQPFPAHSLRLTSLDYQPEREACFTQIQATPESHALLLSRSVWHKVREARHLSLEGLQLSDVFTGLQPAGKPVPGRMTWSADRWQAVLGSQGPESSPDAPNAEGDR